MCLTTVLAAAMMEYAGENGMNIAVYVAPGIHESRNLSAFQNEGLELHPIADAGESGILVIDKLYLESPN